MFKLWSQVKLEVKNELKPNLSLRCWNDLTTQEKIIIWQYLDWYFFDKDPEQYKPRSANCNYVFSGDFSEQELKESWIFKSVLWLNYFYKAQNYAPTFLENGDLNSACIDFYQIFINQSENVVLELLSLYCKAVLEQRAEDEPYKNEGESPEEFEKRTKKWRYEIFDRFTGKINEVFEDFGINVILTRAGFISKQDKRVIEEIYTPVLESLSDSKWKPVNEHLKTSFDDYRKKDYSGSITNSISGVQAFLQILVNGKIGSGKISELILKAQAQSLIPNDVFTKKIFDNIESILARERQNKSGVHPKLEDANEKTARLITNLVMVFIQHCLQEK